MKETNSRWSMYTANNNGWLINIDSRCAKIIVSISKITISKTFDYNALATTSTNTAFTMDTSDEHLFPRWTSELDETVILQLKYMYHKYMVSSSLCNASKLSNMNYSTCKCLENLNIHLEAVDTYWTESKESKCVITTKCMS